MTFETFYASSIQQPVLLWLAALVGLVVVAARSTSRSVRSFCLAFGVLPFFDAWLTADRVMGLGSLGPVTGVTVATAFVIAGDFRALLFLASATPEGTIRITLARTVDALLLSFVVPVFSAIVRSRLPDAPWRAQATFLTYELGFFALVLVLRARGWGATRFAWGNRVTLYVLLYYGLWALSDMLILGLHLDVAYLLRVVPNVLYYGGLLAVISLTAPAAASPSPKQ